MIPKHWLWFVINNTHIMRYLLLTLILFTGGFAYGQIAKIQGEIDSRPSKEAYQDAKWSRLAKRLKISKEQANIIRNVEKNYAKDSVNAFPVEKKVLKAIRKREIESILTRKQIKMYAKSNFNNKRKSQTIVMTNPNAARERKDEMKKIKAKKRVEQKNDAIVAKRKTGGDK